MNIKKIFWPWGVISQLEAQLTDANVALAESKGHIGLLEQHMQNLAEDHKREIVFAAEDIIIMNGALKEIDETVSSVNKPNGTSKKLQRIAQEALGICNVPISEELVDYVRENASGYDFEAA